MALAAAERATAILETPAQAAARWVADLTYDERLAAQLADVESAQVHAVAILGHAWRCLDGRMDLRRFCGYIAVHIGDDLTLLDSQLLAQKSVELALRYTAWERSGQPAGRQAPQAVVQGISEQSAEQAISLAQMIVGPDEIAAIRNTHGSDRAAFRLPPLGAEPPALDFDPSATEQGSYGDPYLPPDLAEALAVEQYFAGGGTASSQDDALWSRVAEDHKLARPIAGQVTAVVRHGLAVSIYDPPVVAFFPFSQIVSRPADIKRIKLPERWVSKRDRFKIFRYDREVGYIVVVTSEEPYGWRPLATTAGRKAR